MLIEHSPDAYEKLEHLGGMVNDDVLGHDKTCTSGAPCGAFPQQRQRVPVPGVYRAAMPNGKSISLMRVLFTDFCKYDCAYCVNSKWVPRRRYGFKVDELARLFMEMHQRQTVAGLFLSSAIPSSSDRTMDKLLDVVEALRGRHGFKGYIHMKVMPGASLDAIEAAYRLGTRLSINIEAPTEEHLKRLSSMKDFTRHIMRPMAAIHKLLQERGDGATGQVTQLVVGASEESDWDIYQRMTQLYGEWGLKRVYYSPFQPVRDTPLEEHQATPILRAHRLYQIDWLSRIYRYSQEELKPAFDDAGLLPLDVDPKLLLALDRLDDGAVDVNAAEYHQLLRVPGIGPISAKRILAQRQSHAIDTWRDLEAMGVVVKRAKAFVGFAGYRPERGKQLKMNVFVQRAKPGPSGHPAGGCSACTTHACGGCPAATLRPTLPLANSANRS